VASVPDGINQFEGSGEVMLGSEVRGEEEREESTPGTDGTD
jgi:hypothetical protein